MIEIIECTQGTPEWFKARAGIPTASEFHTVMAKGKDGGRSTTRDSYMRKLAGELITGDPAPEGYSNGFMERGKTFEPDARNLYALKSNIEVTVVGFLRNGKKGASPDSLVGKNGGLEIKTAIPAVQIERLQRGDLPPEHKAQVQGNMWVSEREWWDFMSYCPKMPELVVRVHRDEAYIQQMAKSIDAFLEELDSMVTWLRGI